jgi:hypothetical protein
MSESQDTASQSEPSRVTSITIDQCAPLGQKLRLDLGRRRTVLVGHNGAGKSAILDAVSQGLRNPFLVAGLRMEPRFFELAIDTPGGSVVYDYQWSPAGNASQPGDEPLDGVSDDWTEKLVTNGIVSWRIDESRAYWFYRPEGEPILPGSSLVSSPRMLGRHTPDSPEAMPLVNGMRAVFSTCSFSRHVPAGVPRARSERSSLVFLLNQETQQWVATTQDRSRATVMLTDLVRRRQLDRAAFDEFQAICLRLDLFRAFEFFEFSPPASAKAEQRLGALICDGMNAGLLSDGTLRVMEIVWSVLETRPGALLAIEEPETGIHPGLLAGLLEEIDAYLGDRQVVISTHSPTVIDRIDANEIRVVVRSEGRTSVAPIAAFDMERLKTYLHAEGELAEFVFEGGL